MYSVSTMTTTLCKHNAIFQYVFNHVFKLGFDQLTVTSYRRSSESLDTDNRREDTESKSTVQRVYRNSFQQRKRRYIIDFTERNSCSFIDRFRDK